MTSFYPANLRNDFYYPEMPWRFSPDLYRRIKRSTPEPGSSYKKCPVFPSDKEWCALEKAVRLKGQRIRRVYAIHHGGRTQNFENTLINIETTAFPNKWTAEKDAPERQKVIEIWKRQTDQFTPLSLMERAKDGFNGRFDKVRVLPAFHAFGDPAIGHSICHSGFVIPGKHRIIESLKKKIFPTASGVTDPGYYGSGIYFSSSAEYVRSAYGGPNVPFLMSCVSMGNPYPVIMSDFRSIDPITNTEVNRLEGQGAHDFHTAHYIPVIREVGKVYVPSLNPECDEVVVFDPAQTLPLFLIYLQPDFLPSEPSMTPKCSGELIDFLLNVLQHPAVQSDCELQDVLKEKGKFLMLFGDHACLSPEEGTLYEQLKVLVTIEGALDATAKARLIETLSQEKKALLEKLSEFSQQFNDYIERDLSVAWDYLFLAAPRLLRDEPIKLQGYLGRLLRTCAWEKKTDLFEKIVNPLRTTGLPTENARELEKHLARWYDMADHKKRVSEAKWHEELLLPMFDSYSRALYLGDDLYQEISRAFAVILFENLPSLDKSIDQALKNKDQPLLEGCLQTLSAMRDNFCPYLEDRQLLSKYYIKLAPFFETKPDHLYCPFIETGMTPAIDTSFPNPYIQRCREALKNWKTSFSSLEILSLFPSLCPDREKGFELLFTTLKHLPEIDGSEGAINIDFGSIQKEKQELLLEVLRRLFKFQKEPPEVLSIHNAAALTSKDLLLFLHPELTYLDLQGSKLDALPPVVLPCLKTLNLTGCEMLAPLQIDARALKELKVSKKNISNLIVKGNLATVIHVEDDPDANLSPIFPAFKKELSKQFCVSLGEYLLHVLKQSDIKNRTMGKALLKLLRHKADSLKESKFQADYDLKKLDLSNKMLADRGVMALSTVLSESLVNLNLSLNQITAKGVADLSEMLPYSNIIKLNLSMNGLRSEGAGILASVLPQTKIKILDLSLNLIEDKGARALLQTLPQSQVLLLDLGDNRIGKETAKQFDSLFNKNGEKITVNFVSSASS